MKIAVYVDDSEKLASFYEKGTVRIYDNASGSWQAGHVIPFEIKLDMTLAEVKRRLKAVGGQLGDCRSFLSGEVRGLLYSVLQEEMGIHTWKSEGSLHEQLDFVVLKEQALAIQQEKDAAELALAPPAPVFSGGGCGGGGRGGIYGPAKPAWVPVQRIKDGHYRIDLAEAMRKYPNLNSRQALIPFLEGTPFQKLEILCDHIPRWFSRKLDELNLMVEVESPNGPAHGVRASVSPRA